MWNQDSQTVSSEGVCPDPSHILVSCSWILEWHKLPWTLAILTIDHQIFLQKSKTSAKVAAREFPIHLGKRRKESFQHVTAGSYDRSCTVLFDKTAETEWHTETNRYGLGTLLVKTHKRMEKAIAYTLRIPTKAKNNYSTTEKEYVAVIWAIDKFHSIYTERCSLLLLISILFVG